MNITGTDIVVPCMYHSTEIGRDDTVPSLNIYFTGQMFHCFGCGISGNWNKIARDFGLEEIHALKKYEEDLFALNEKQLKKLMEGRKSDMPPMTIPVIKDRWRRMDNAFLHSVNTSQWFDPVYKVERMLWPVNTIIMGRAVTVGYTSRAIGSAVEGIPKYYSSDGLESEMHMFPEDIIYKMKVDRCLIVEGQVDSLFMIYNKIPSLGILGVKTWKREEVQNGLKLSVSKINKLIKLGIRKTLIVMDGDAAGYMAAKNIQSDLSQAMSKSEVYEVEEGKDPAKLKRREIEAVRKALYSM